MEYSSDRRAKKKEYLGYHTTGGWWLPVVCGYHAPSFGVMDRLNLGSGKGRPCHEIIPFDKCEVVDDE
jgi:hypothetical protein